MDAAVKLLSAALDTEGYICIFAAQPGGAERRQPFFNAGDFEGAVAKAYELDAQGFNTYFATSTFTTNENRKAPNVARVKNFKIDFDIAVDDEAKYKSIGEAWNALKVQSKQYGLPPPSAVVHSGSGHAEGGMHVYWCLDEAMPAPQATIYSEKFKHILISLGLKIDRTVTADMARVLRIPGTRNHKHESKPPVVLQGDIREPLVKQDFLDLIDAIYVQVAKVKAQGELPDEFIPGVAIPAHIRNQELDASTKALLGNRPKKFSIIVRKSLEDEGCAQIKHIIENQAMIEEPLWRAGLSIAHYCDDGPTAIHKMSSEHPGYSPEETQQKAEGTVGPWTCKTFSDNWPERCKGCAHAGTIKSPISLGAYLKKASPTDNVVLAMNTAIDDAKTAYTIPEYPWPYFRKEGGGVCVRVKNKKKKKSDDGMDDIDDTPREGTEDDDENVELVCKQDIYLIDRLFHPSENQYYAHLRFHAGGTDGIKEIIFPTAEVISPDTLSKNLAEQGLFLTSKSRKDHMAKYIDSWFSRLRMEREAAVVKTQFGWTSDSKKFVIGEREYQPDGSMKYSPPAPNIAGIAEKFKKVGSYDEWKSVINTYADHEEFTPHAFVALCGFASPLLSLLDVNGALVNAFNKDSGIGKTGALRVAQSVWGHPDDLMLQKNDTDNAKFNRMGVYKNIVITIDEITKMTHEAFSSFVLATTNGRGKHRMQASTNEERVNEITWSLLTVASSNTSFVDMLQSEKTGVQGELMRLVEVEIPATTVLTKAQSDEIFNKLKTNYGWAGEEFMSYVVRNRDAVKRRLVDQLRATDGETKMVGPERFWSAIMACVEVGGRISYELGIHRIDMDNMHRFIVHLIGVLRSRIRVTAETNYHDMLLDYVHQNTNNTLVVLKNSRGVWQTADGSTFRGKLLIRFEKDTNRLMVADREFDKWLVDKNEQRDTFFKKLDAAGVYKGASRVRMAQGTDLPGALSKAYIFELEGDPTIEK